MEYADEAQCHSKPAKRRNFNVAVKNVTRRHRGNGRGWAGIHALFDIYG